MANKTDVLREQITKQIAEAMRENHMPWRRPWRDGRGNIIRPYRSGLPCNFLTGRSYSGVNPLILMMVAERHGLTSRYWGTHKQWRELGAFVKPHPAEVAPSDWGARIVFWNVFEKPVDDDENKKKTKKKTNIKAKVKGKPNVVRPEDEEEEVEKIWFLRSFTLFNADQVAAPDPDYLMAHPKALESYAKSTGLDMKDKRKLAQKIHDTVEAKLVKYRVPKEGEPLPVKPKTEGEVFEPAEKLMKASKADIRYGGSRAFYKRRPSDYIQLPQRDQFEHLSAFYETAFHELVHWCEDDSRVGRPKADDDRHQYAYCELVAEIGACFLAQTLGIPFAASLLPNNKSYLKSWLQRMGDDPKFIFQASTQASKAVDYLLAFVGLNEEKVTVKEMQRATGTMG